MSSCVKALPVQERGGSIIEGRDATHQRLRAPSGSWCVRLGKSCSGHAVANAAGGMAQLAPCPCRLLFPFGAVEPSWWIRRELAGSHETQNTPRLRTAVFHQSSAFVFLPGWADLSDAPLAEVCLWVRAILSKAPSVVARHEMHPGPYGELSVHLTEDQAHILQNAFGLLTNRAVRESVDHVLLSADEIPGQMDRVFRRPKRLIILLLSAAEAGFLANSENRLSRLCTWLRRLEAQDHSLVVFSGVPLLPGGAQDGVQEFEDPKGLGARSPGLVFGARRRSKSRSKQGPPSLAGLFEQGDQELLHLLLIQGRTRLQEWSFAWMGGADSGVPYWGVRS